MNFLLLPGGGADVCAGRYAEVGRMLLNMSMGENDAGEYMAVWGTCLGYEQMAVAVSGECQILDRFDAEDDARCDPARYIFRDMRLTQRASCINRGARQVCRAGAFEAGGVE